MKYLITGIDGFTGLFLKRKIEENNFKVFGTSFSENPDPNIFKCDINNKLQICNILKTVKPDVIFHLAAVSFVKSDALKIYKTNVIGTLNLLDSLIELNQNPYKIILASSASVYGNQEGVLDENTNLKPLNHYGNSKLVMENMVFTYFNKLNIIITRPFNYIGKGQNQKFLVSKIISHYLNNCPKIELGNINIKREFNNVNDVVDIYYRLSFTKIKSEILNISSGKSYSIKNILDILDKEFKCKMKVSINPDFVRVNDIYDLKGNNFKLKKVLNDYNLFTGSLKDTLLSIVK